MTKAVISLIQSLIKPLAWLFGAFFIRKSGADAEKKKRLEKNEKAREERQEIENDTHGMSNDELNDWLSNNR